MGHIYIIYNIYLYLYIYISPWYVLQSLPLCCFRSWHVSKWWTLSAAISDSWAPARRGAAGRGGGWEMMAVGSTGGMPTILLGSHGLSMTGWWSENHRKTIG